MVVLQVRTGSTDVSHGWGLFVLILESGNSDCRLLMYCGRWTPNAIFIHGCV